MSNVAILKPVVSKVQINPIVAVTTKEVYGKSMVYPANPQAAIFARMVGTKTLTLDTLLSAQALGFRIVVAYPTGEVEVSDPRKLY